MKDCIFCKIRDRKIAKEFTYEDEDIMVFPDIHPYKSTHLLIVPKEHIEDFGELNDQVLMTKIKTVLDKMVSEKLNGKGYRIAINGGGAQAIQHLHFHLMGPISQNEI
jgi:histidine triad (HIT) family protein